MSSDGIDEEEKIAQERLSDDVDELIHGTIGELGTLPSTLVSLDRSATVSEATEAMIRNRIGAIAVIEDGKLCGLFSERDVLTRVVAAGRSPEATALADVMTSSPEFLSLDHEVVYALNSMTVGGYRHIPIVDSTGQPVSMLSMRDVMEHIVSFYSNEVFNLPTSGNRMGPSRREGA